MKKLSFALAVVAFISSGFAQAANSSLGEEIAFNFANRPISPMNLINWKIGDFQDCNINAEGMTLGTIHRVVESNEGNGVWLKEETSGALIGQHTTEILLDRGSGRILKFKQDGKDTTPPSDSFKVTHSDKATITVPAGTFDTVHYTGTSQKPNDTEIWLNDQEINIDGMAQMKEITQNIPIMIQLAKFGHN